MLIVQITKRKECIDTSEAIPWLITTSQIFLFNIVKTFTFDYWTCVWQRSHKIASLLPLKFLEHSLQRNLNSPFFVLNSPHFRVLRINYLLMIK